MNRLGIVAFLLTITLSLATSSTLMALDQGGLETGVIFDALRFRTAGQEFFLSEFAGYADFRQNLTNYGVLEGRLAMSHYYEDDGPGSLMRGEQAFGRLTFRDFHWGRSILQVTAGDQAFQMSKLPVSFTNLFYPALYFRGLSLGATHPCLQLELLGGGMTISKGLLGITFQETGEDVYGIAARTQPTERLALEGNFFQTRNEKDFEGNLVTRSNSVYRAAGALRTWSKLYALGEFMQSFAENPESRKEQDIAYRAGLTWRGERLNLEGNYRFEGRDFHLLGPIYQSDQNVKGFFFAGDYSPWPFLGISGSYDSAKNNLLLDPSKSINESESRSLGVRLYRPPWPTLYWRYYSGDIATRGDFPVAVHGSTQGHYAELSKAFGFLDAYLRYEHFEYDDKVSSKDSYRKSSPLGGIRVSRSKFTAYGEVEYDQFSPATQGSGSNGLYLKSGGSYAISKSLFIFGEVNYRPGSERYGGQLGVDWQLPYGFSLRAFGQAQTGKAGVGDFINNYTTNQICLRLTKTFSWGEKTRSAGMKSGQEWLGTGAIEGWVFDDKNLNGALDRDEKGVDRIKVRLEDGSTVLTDNAGRYYFPSVGAGKHVVMLDAARIPAAYSFVGSENVTVEVKHRGNARVDFPFILGANIRGRVAAARSGGEKTPPAAGVPDVLVVLKPGNLNTYTDNDGYFSFDCIIPGTYEVRLAPDTLPARSEVLPPDNVSVKLSPGEHRHDLLFSIHKRERRVVFEGAS